MRPTVLLIFYLSAVLIGGALLAPGLYFLTKTAASHFPILERLSHQPFSRFVNRSMLILAVIGIWPLARAFGQKNISSLGFAPGRDWKKSLAGFLVGFGSLALVAAMTVLFGQREINSQHSAAELIRHFLNAAMAALLVAIIEELIFRGIVFGGLRKSLSWSNAAILSSAVYALVHFFRRTPPSENISWLSGFIVLGQMSGGFTEVQTLIPGFINLFIAGMILATAYQITGTLYFSIGLHAGWIFWLKSFGFFTRPIGPATNFFWGTSKLIDGWSAMILLGSLLFIFLRRPKDTRNNG